MNIYTVKDKDIYTVQMSNFASPFWLYFLFTENTPAYHLHDWNYEEESPVHFLLMSQKSVFPGFPRFLTYLYINFVLQF